MADLPYVINSGTIGKFLKTVQTTGTPNKVTVKYLESIGYKSKNDRYLIAFLKDLGFLKSDGEPSETWLAYRHTEQAPGVLGTAIKAAWPGLFQLYPDAHRKDDEAIRNWMRTHAPSAAPITVDRSLKTFKAIVTLAEFTDDEGHTPTPATGLTPERPGPPMAAVAAVSQQVTPEVVINIQLEVPATNDPDTYDRFFAAMRKHLFPGDD